MGDIKQLVPKKRLGRISISKQITISHMDNIKNTLAAIRFFPYRVEFLAHADCFDMIGESEQFDEVEQGIAVPFYELKVRTNPGGDVVHAVRVDG